MLTNGEQAFGLVELLVATVVSIIAIGVFLMIFTQAYRHTSALDAQSISAAEISDALDRIGDDVRAARKLERAEIADVATRDDLQKRFKDSPEAYNDVVVASGRELAMWSDSESDPAGPRCVTWSFAQVQDDRLVWAVVRRSGPPGGACPYTTGPAETVAKLGVDEPARDAFSYNVLQATATPGRCNVNPMSPAGNLSADDRLRIVGVDVDLGAIASRRGTRRIADGRSSIDLWSRLNNDYYYAVECAL